MKKFIANAFVFISFFVVGFILTNVEQPKKTAEAVKLMFEKTSTISNEMAKNLQQNLEEDLSSIFPSEDKKVYQGGIIWGVSVKAKSPYKTVGKPKPKFFANYCESRFKERNVEPIPGKQPFLIVEAILLPDIKTYLNI